MTTATSTTAISLLQIAALVGVAPNHMRTDLLPPTYTAHTGEPGRPVQVITLEDLAAFIDQRTGHLNDSEVRLRLAMSNHCARISKRTCAKPGPFRLLDNGDGTFRMDPTLLPNEFTLTEQRGLRAAVTEKRP